jgi:hypothetical protein
MEFPFVDTDLARRLERVEAQSNIDFVEARALTDPSSGARWISEDGAFAMFDGVESPLTQTFGLGMFEPATASGLEKIEGFFAGFGAPVYHEVSPLADPSALALLNERNYEPFEFTSVMYQPIAAADAKAGPSTSVAVRVVGAGEMDLWAETAARGWASESQELGDFMLSFGKVSARKASGFSFLASLDGQPIAAGGLTIHGGVALFAGASTVLEGRRKGAQTALLDARFAFAASRGCTLAMMCALPGSASQRNAERRGFRIAYTRVKWRRRRV